MFKPVFLDFLPEFDSSVVGRRRSSLNRNDFFLGLSKNENKDKTGNGIDGVIFLRNTNMSVDGVLDETG